MSRVQPLLLPEVKPQPQPGVYMSVKISKKTIEGVAGEFEKIASKILELRRGHGAVQVEVVMYGQYRKVEAEVEVTEPSQGKKAYMACRMNFFYTSHHIAVKLDEAMDDNTAGEVLRSIAKVLRTCGMGFVRAAVEELAKYYGKVIVEVHGTEFEVYVG